MAKKRSVSYEPENGYCKECGERLTGLKERWCSSQCGTRFRARAQRWAFDQVATPNSNCLHCKAPVAAGLWWCSEDCRIDYRRDGGIRPSRYDRPEFYRARGRL